MAGTIRKQLGAEISRNARDPRLSSLHIENVEVAGDLGLVKVGVRLLRDGDSEAERRGVLGALRAMAPGLRASLGPLLRVRRLPELQFYYDDRALHVARIEAVLAEIHEEDAERARTAALTPEADASDASDAPASSPERN